MRGQIQLQISQQNSNRHKILLIDDYHIMQSGAICIVYFCACPLIVCNNSTKDFHSRRQEDKCKEFLFIKFTLTTRGGWSQAAAARRSGDETEGSSQ